MYWIQRVILRIKRSKARLEIKRGRARARKWMVTPAAMPPIWNKMRCVHPPTEAKRYFKVIVNWIRKSGWTATGKTGKTSAQIPNPMQLMRYKVRILIRVRTRVRRCSRIIHINPCRTNHVHSLDLRIKTSKSLMPQHRTRIRTTIFSRQLETHSAINFSKITSKYRRWAWTSHSKRSTMQKYRKSCQFLRASRIHRTIFRTMMIMTMICRELFNSRGSRRSKRASKWVSLRTKAAHYKVCKFNSQLSAELNSK